MAALLGLLTPTSSFVPSVPLIRGRLGISMHASSSVLPSSAYVHIPFCKQRCYYCDFPISVVGADTSRPGAKSVIDRYLDSLAIELDRGGGGALAPARPSPDIGTALTTIYLGGGTPSLLEPRQVDRILRALDQRFGIAADAEISMEMDPGTFDFVKASGMHAGTQLIVHLLILKCKYPAHWTC